MGLVMSCKTKLFSIIKKIIMIEITIDGIWFLYKGDEVLYTWPWRRKSGYKFISLCCEGGFNSLKEMNNFWTEYAVHELIEKYCDKDNCKYNS